MLYLSGIIIAFFLFFVLITKKNKTAADYILAAWIGITGFHLFTFYLMFTGQYDKYSSLIVIGFALPFVQGPFLYLYTRQQTSAQPFRSIFLLHFLPVLFCWLSFSSFFFLSEQEKIAVFRNKGAGFETINQINVYGIYLSGIIYITLSLIKLMQYRKNLVHQFSNTEKINFNWLLYLIIWLTVIWIVILFVRDDQWIFGAAALFVVWLGYFGIKQVQVFTQTKPFADAGKPPVKDPGNQLKAERGVERPTEELQQELISVAGKYQKSALTEEDVLIIHEKLKKLLNTKKPFRNAELTLTELSGMLEVQPNHLSQVINSRENKNFYDLINEKRVEEFIRVLSKPGSKQYTLLSLAFECGFNSKASFNRNFKKYTGLSPRDYQKQQQPA